MLNDTQETNDSAAVIDNHDAQLGISVPAYRIDPLLAAIMPPLGEENYLALKENVRRDGGVLHALVVWKETGILLDGHHREKADRELRDAGIELAPMPITYVELPDRLSAQKWVLNNAKGTRQNFGTFQKIAQIVSNIELMETLTSEAKAHQKLGGKAEYLGSTLDPREDATAEVARVIAGTVGCGESTAKKCLAVLRHGKKHSLFLDAVMNGEITAHSAYKAIRGEERRNQKRDRIAQNMPAAHEAVRKAADDGKLFGKVHHADVFVGMSQLADKSISLVFTSPPYPLTDVKYPNEEVEPFYDGDYPKYLDKMKRFFAECKRVLVTGGKLVMNFDNCNVKPEERTGNEVRRDCRTDFAVIARDSGFIFVDEYIWGKQNAVGTRPAIGTKGSPSGHRVNNNTEYVCVWANEVVSKAPEIEPTPDNDRIDLMEEEQFRLSMQLWQIKPADRTKTKHRAAFPDELARRVIRLYTFVGDTVCDPFSGSGTTGAMASRMGRNFVGFDVFSEYAMEANQRIADALENPLPVEEVPDWSDQRELKRAKNNEVFKGLHRAQADERKVIGTDGRKGSDGQCEHRIV